MAFVKLGLHLMKPCFRLSGFLRMPPSVRVVHLEGAAEKLAGFYKRSMFLRLRLWYASLR